MAQENNDRQKTDNNRSYTALKQVIISVAVLAEILRRSPRKLFIFIIKK